MNSTKMLTKNDTKSDDEFFMKQQTDSSKRKSFQNEKKGKKKKEKEQISSKKKIHSSKHKRTESVLSEKRKNEKRRKERERIKQEKAEIAAKRKKIEEAKKKREEQKKNNELRKKERNDKIKSEKKKQKDTKEKKKNKKSKEDSDNAKAQKALQKELQSEKMKKIAVSDGVYKSLKTLHPTQRRKIEQEIKKQLEREKNVVLSMKEEIAAERKRNQREQNALMTKFEKEQSLYRKDLDALNAEKKAISQQLEDIAALRKDLESKNRHLTPEKNKKQLMKKKRKKKLQQKEATLVALKPNEKEKQNEFVYPQKSDYLLCAMQDHDISNCNVMKRIIHFLQFYEEQQFVDESISIYEHMQSLNGYDISQFLEDWYQVKINHLNKDKNALDFLQDIIKNNDCDGSNECKYVRRYQRDREKDKIEPKSKDFDVRNFILMDQMDSIHSFLFHSMQRRDTFVPFGDVNDEKNKSLNECSAEQIIHIFNKDIFVNLKKKNKEKIQKHKEKIIECIKENKLNGMKLCKMKRKEFINLFTAYLDDKKLTAAMGIIYKDLMVYKQQNANENNVIISSKSKFITEEKIANNDDDDEKKKEYYSFGEKYLYNPKLSKSPLFVKPKYASIKQELFEYYARENKDDDASELLKEQIQIIDAMDQRFQPLVREFVNEQPITSSDVLWKKDIETSRKQLRGILSKLCEYAKDFDVDDWNENNSNIAMESVDIAFKVYAINKIQKAIKINKEIYIHQPRVNVFIEKCKLKMKMESVKRMKAAKNKSNKDYGIKKDDPIGFEHVFALILYSQCTKLCTAFRFTYRRLKNESLADYKQRHSLYANMGRLLFECFLFFSSTNSKVSVLYHGMGIELLFKALECKFIAPTSTTTEESVACNFGSGGVVMKLESAESNKFIKTIDMSLFSCFDNECEHFIFDYKLRIIDLFIPRIRSWIGKSYMNRLLLLDLLSNNIFVDNEQFLKEKNQKGLVKILECIKDGKMSTYTKYEYVNAFIESLITQNDGIKFNMKNAQSLASELRTLFINEKNSPFKIQYQDGAISICKLRQHK